MRRDSGNWREYLWSWHQACHHLKDIDQTIVKFTNRKDCLRTLRVKRQLKGLDPSAVDLSEGTKIFINESLCPYYRGIRNKLRDKWKVYQYYTINGLIRLRIEKSGQAKTISYMVDLQSLFPDIDINGLWLYFCFFFFLIFAGKVFVALYFLESFVFYHIFAY